MKNPFDSGSDDEDPFLSNPQSAPSMPYAAYTSDRTSPRKTYQPLNFDSEDEDAKESEFMAFPLSTSGSPFHQQQSQDNHLIFFQKYCKSSNLKAEYEHI